jgi:hypothetical protein
MNLTDQSAMHKTTQNVKPGVLREMSHLERAFNQIPGLKVTMVVRLEGKVDPVSLQTALCFYREHGDAPGRCYHQRSPGIHHGLRGGS